MKRFSLLAAAGVILVANTFALFHAWRNRSGRVETDITLTERELHLSYTMDKDDSAVSLDLRRSNAAWDMYRWEPEPWLDPKTLQELGFDTSVAPSTSSTEFYQQQRARRAFLALEYDGPAWRKHVQQTEQELERAGSDKLTVPSHSHEAESHLVGIDASTDPVRLRARHPDRNSIIIVPAVIRIWVQPVPSGPARLSGSIQEIPSSVHVPRPFSDAFRRLPRGARYRVHLRYGGSYEPWIVGVEFPASSEQ